ncbi:helix-turn-helix transcriptional regulator [Chitinimonas sp. BJB300]|uniref:helix-turn-helix transcriptional regulator n=1 Tax=Chitinimonas sp. BJB300 TaxID=1559339 RepID=UPI000C0CF311|nr:helix-turn-helix transcriptional regulator [Chitinimonas sp. BJB300]PHV10235.1 transcriptional regulator [Chitinimonas sp. BJB300]TSJ87555.1 helix-turn-helix transcriptional regulator [Chitinimonas sp. BJB300]
MGYPIKTLSQLRPILLGFRKEAGLTQAAIAQKLGITQQSYAALEANPEAASFERVFKVLRLLDVNIRLVSATQTTDQRLDLPSKSRHSVPTKASRAAKTGVFTEKGTSAATQAAPSKKLFAASEAPKQLKEKTASTPPKRVNTAVKKRGDW